jgi:hypothetical protein
MDKLLENVIKHTLKKMLTEAPAQETDNAQSDSVDSLFTPAEEKFLGKFDAYGSRHLGIIYSISDIGIREFIERSGKDLNVTPGILLNLLKNKIIKFVPYTGWGRNNDYTIELQLSLDDVKGLGAEDKKEIEKGSDAAGGGSMPPSEITPPAPEVAWVVKYGDILKESVKITKKLITESPKNASNTSIMQDKTRILQRLPKDYLSHMNRIIKMMDKKTKTVHEKERLIADVLDILQLSFNLSPKAIRQSYDFHKSQKRLQKYLEKNK